jgi:hypothetical protein
MSNVQTAFIFGCRPIDRYFPHRKEVLEEAQLYYNGAGWHNTYDANEDIIWFGAVFGKVSGRCGSIPDCPGTLKIQVRGMFDELPEHIREELSAPQEYIMTWLD